MEVVIMDTDFAYEYLTKNEEAIEVVRKNSNALFFLPFTTVAELTKATFNVEMLRLLNSRLEKIKLEILQIDEEISILALRLIQQFHLSHTASIPDMLIAATAIKYDCLLATCNSKHFKYIPDLKLLNHNVTPKRGGFMNQ